MDIMIDLETLGTKSHCVVVSLGACLFDISKGQLGPTFYMICTIQDQLDKGRKIDADTLKWWFSQSDAAKKVFNDKSAPTLQVLNTFSQWIGANVPTKRDRKVWGNGSTFDISIMESLFDSYNVECPWNFSSVMDLRTYRRFIGNNAKIEKQGVAHNALDDAISQAKFVMEFSNKPSAI